MLKLAKLYINLESDASNKFQNGDMVMFTALLHHLFFWELRRQIAVIFES